MHENHPPHPRHQTSRRQFYERRHQPLISTRAFMIRQIGHIFVAAGIVIVSLGIGILGYRQLEGMSWIDSLLNASMILGGMGPVGELHTNAGKIFASCYALFAGMIFLVVAGVLFAPIFHRFLHKFHLTMEEKGEEK